MERWKSRIRAALGPNGQLVTRVIPELELMIGPQPPLPEMGALESRNRFNCHFIGVHRLFSVKRPIPWLFFWTTCSGWTLILSSWWNSIAQDPERKPLLFLGAYRDNEVEADHQLMISSEVIKKSGLPAKTIPLKPLNPEITFHKLLVHTCHCRPEEANPLAEAPGAKNRR